MSRILVIVVTYNGRPWLDRCLGSVAAAAATDSCDSVPLRAGGVPENGTLPSKTAQIAGGVPENGTRPALAADLYVVDNDSTDGSADYVQAHFPRARLVRSAENLGFSKANNLGLKYAMERGYDYAYLLNQDAWLAPGALETLVEAAEAHPDYAVLSPLQYQDGYQALDAQFAKLFPSADPVRMETPAEGRIVPVKRVMAAHWLIPTVAVKKMGLFSENLFPMYGQDDDWCQRARYHGFKIGVVPGARAVHDRARREEPLQKLVFRNYYMGSLVRLADINRPLWERFAYVCLFTLVKAVKYGSSLPFKYFRTLCGQLPDVKAHRRKVR